MYDAATIRRAVELVAEGHNPREVSRMMGGSPSHAIIRRWANGDVPTGVRRSTRLFTAQEKLQAVHRLKSGEHYEDIGRDIGCAGSTVLTWRRILEEKGQDGLRTRVDDVL